MNTRTDYTTGVPPHTAGEPQRMAVIARPRNTRESTFEAPQQAGHILPTGPYVPQEQPRQETQLPIVAKTGLKVAPFVIAGGERLRTGPLSTDALLLTLLMYILIEAGLSWCFSRSVSQNREQIQINARDIRNRNNPTPLDPHLTLRTPTIVGINRYETPNSIPENATSIKLWLSYLGSESNPRRHIQDIVITDNAGNTIDGLLIDGDNELSQGTYIIPITDSRNFNIILPSNGPGNIQYPPSIISYLT